MSDKLNVHNKSVTSKAHLVRRKCPTKLFRPNMNGNVRLIRLWTGKNASLHRRNHFHHHGWAPTPKRGRLSFIPSQHTHTLSPITTRRFRSACTHLIYSKVGKAGKAFAYRKYVHVRGSHGAECAVSVGWADWAEAKGSSPRLSVLAC